MDVSLLFQKGENSPALQGSMEGGMATCIQRWKCHKIRDLGVIWSRPPVPSTCTRFNVF